MRRVRAASGSVLPVSPTRLDKQPSDVPSIGSGAYRVVDLVASDYARVSELSDRYSDAEIGFVDAAVFAVVERLGESKLATLDRRNFSLLRPRHRASLDLVPV